MQQTIEHNNIIIVNTNKAWETSQLPAYIGDISYFPEEMQGIIRQRFPEMASIERANIIFVGSSELAANYKLLQDAAAGKYIVFPGDADYTLLRDGVEPIISPNASEGLIPIFCCYTGWGEGHFYTMYKESAPMQLEMGTSSLTDEEWSELNEKGMAEEGETDDERAFDCLDHMRI